MSLQYFKKKRQDVKRNGNRLYSRIYTLENGDDLKANQINDLVKNKIKKLFRRNKLSLNKNIFITYLTSSGFSFSSKFFFVGNVADIDNNFIPPRVNNDYFASIDNNSKIEKIIFNYY